MQVAPSAFIDEKAQCTTPNTDFQEQITAAAEQLQTRGWAVVPSVLTAEECQQYQDGVWSWLSHVGSGINRWAEPSRLEASLYINSHHADAYASHVVHTQSCTLKV